MEILLRSALLLVATRLSLVALANGLIMLISPRVWFALPSWLAFDGVLNRKKYGSGPGALQVRIPGLIFAGSVMWGAGHLILGQIGAME